MACQNPVYRLPSRYRGCTNRSGLLVIHFFHVEHLGMEINRRDIEGITLSLIPFHGFSPVLKSLHIASSAFLHLRMFNLICSFPLLEDVSLQTKFHSLTDSGDHGFNEQPTITQSSSSPPFTGSLELRLHSVMEPIASSLLSSPGSLCFQQLCLVFCCEEEVLSMTALVEGCCSTLESLEIKSGPLGTFFRQPCLH